MRKARIFGANHQGRLNAFRYLFNQCNVPLFSRKLDTFQAFQLVAILTKDRKVAAVILNFLVQQASQLHVGNRSKNYLMNELLPTSETPSKNHR
jgi:hypothetical protein